MVDHEIQKEIQSVIMTSEKPLELAVRIEHGERKQPVVQSK